MIFDACCTAALGIPYDRARWRELSTLSGGEQKRLALEALLRGPDQVLLLDEPDNYLDVPGKRWLEAQLASTHEVGAAGQPRPGAARPGRPDRSPCSSWARPATRSGSTAARFGTLAEARRERFARFEELRRRWDEEHQKLKDLVQMYKIKAAYNDGMASRYQAAKTRLAKFEEAGPPQAVPLEQQVSMRLSGGRTAKRAVVIEPGADRADEAVQHRDLVRRPGRRAGLQRLGQVALPAAAGRGGSDPDVEHRPVEDAGHRPGRPHRAAKLGARVRPGWFAQTHHHPELLGRTLLEILHRGDHHRAGMGREEASRKLDRYELAKAAEQRFESLSGGQQARFQILLLELSGATLLLLDEPTDNLDLESAEALEHGLDAFDGTVVAVTHDRWFARSFDRFLVFGADGEVYESDEPVWDEARVQRAR